jgi:hypothetical protein
VCVDVTWDAEARARHGLESGLSESRDSDSRVRTQRQRAARLRRRASATRDAPCALERVHAAAAPAQGLELQALARCRGGKEPLRVMGALLSLLQDSANAFSNGFRNGFCNAAAAAAAVESLRSAAAVRLCGCAAVLAQPLPHRIPLRDRPGCRSRAHGSEHPAAPRVQARIVGLSDERAAARGYVIGSEEERAARGAGPEPPMLSSAPALLATHWAARVQGCMHWSTYPAPGITQLTSGEPRRPRPGPPRPARTARLAGPLAKRGRPTPRRSAPPRLGPPAPAPAATPPPPPPPRAAARARRGPTRRSRPGPAR